jgi:uroporphyrinogen III methyltransferase / synthase
MRLKNQDNSNPKRRVGPSSQDRPLQGRTILLTRGRSQSAEMTALLESLGAQVINCPMIEIIEPEDWTTVDIAIDNLRNYSYVVFTSANGVRYFLKRLRQRNAELPSDGLVVCAIGTATATTLEAAGLKVDLVAAKSNSEGVLSTLLEHCGGPENVSRLSFLIPRANIASELLPVELRKLGADVDAIEVYRTVRPEVDQMLILRMLASGAIDAVTFLSPSAVSNFAAVTGRDMLSKLMNGTMVACIGSVTAAAARDLGLPDPVTPESADVPALVAAIAKALGPVNRDV